MCGGDPTSKADLKPLHNEPSVASSERRRLAGRAAHASPYSDRYTRPLLPAPPRLGRPPAPSIKVHSQLQHKLPHMTRWSLTRRRLAPTGDSPIGYSRTHVPFTARDSAAASRQDEPFLRGLTRRAMCVPIVLVETRLTRPNTTTVIWRSLRATVRSSRGASGFIRLPEDQARAQEAHADDSGPEC